MEDEQNIFMKSEGMEETRPPDHGNNCQGHTQSIQMGGQGHWYGDSCGCDGQPSASIEMWLPLLLLVALVLILKQRNNGK